MHIGDTHIARVLSRPRLRSPLYLGCCPCHAFPGFSDDFLHHRRLYTKPLELPPATRWPAATAPSICFRWSRSGAIDYFATRSSLGPPQEYFLLGGNISSLSRRLSIYQNIQGVFFLAVPLFPPHFAFPRPGGWRPLRLLWDNTLLLRLYVSVLFSLRTSQTTA